jgi:hypothetical protein
MAARWIRPNHGSNAFCSETTFVVIVRTTTAWQSSFQQPRCTTAGIANSGLDERGGRDMVKKSLSQAFQEC